MQETCTDSSFAAAKSLNAAQRLVQSSVMLGTEGRDSASLDARDENDVEEGCPGLSECQRI